MGYGFRARDSCKQGSETPECYLMEGIGSQKVGILLGDFETSVSLCIFLCYPFPQESAEPTSLSRRGLRRQNRESKSVETRTQSQYRTRSSSASRTPAPKVLCHFGKEVGRGDTSLSNADDRILGKSILLLK